MKKIIIVFILLTVTLFFTLGCSGIKANSETDVKQIITEVADKDSGDDPERIYSLVKKLSQTNIKVPSKIIKKPEYTISDAYNKDAVDFKSLPAVASQIKRPAVVGKDGVQLYETVQGKEIICALPKGTVLPLLEEIKNTGKKDDDCPHVFVFNGENNIWYRTEYKGRSGYIFGAYIVFGDDSDVNAPYSKIAIENSDMIIRYGDSNLEKLKKLSYYYTKPAKSNLFYDFNGRRDLNAEIKKNLRKNRIAFEKVKFREYREFLNAGNDMTLPDDMIALYDMLHNDVTATTFITTDLLAHSLHLLFDRMLQDTESGTLLPVLKALTKSYYNALVNLENGKNRPAGAYAESITLMKKYFMVAGDLLRLNLEEVKNYPADVSAELSKIKSANGTGRSAIFNYREDYSQFKPRGHYTKSENLKTYFRTMMWFGRLHFYCVARHPDADILNNSLRLTRAALVLTKIAKEDRGILALWRAVSTPIEYIVGKSDDYTLDQYAEISGDVDFGKFDEWIGEKKNILKFIENANKNLPPPALSGNTLMQNAVADRNSPVTPAGFRFIGQRFTLDGFIHTMLSMPRVKDRGMVKGLDVIAALGSALADKMLQGDKDRYPGYKNNYDALKSKLRDMNDDGWRDTYYNNTLRIIGEIAGFDSRLPFYFTRNRLWDVKSLLTAHGVWAELKHDTILYAKQNAAEKAGPGPCETYDIDKLLRPIGYIEPNLGALYWMRSVVEDGIAILSENNFMSERFAAKYREFAKLLRQEIDIAEREAADREIGIEQNEFIYSIPGKLANIVMPIDGSIISQDDLKMALIADVHTDSGNGVVLEVGTGIPYRMYVALNDGTGGKRIATGYVYSYYEFEQPIADRLNDEQWKKQVYEESPRTDKYAPGWASELFER